MVDLSIAMFSSPEGTSYPPVLSDLAGKAIKISGISHEQLLPKMICHFPNGNYPVVLGTIGYDHLP